MSIIGCMLLHEIVKVKGIADSKAIIEHLHGGIYNMLKQEEGRNADGMDISVCIFEKAPQSISMQFTGAKSTIFVAQQGTVLKTTGDRIAVGGRKRQEREYNTQQFELQPGDCVYLTTDGFLDQNNAEGQKLGAPKFLDLLCQAQSLPTLIEQSHLLHEALQQHQGEEAQRDDISVLGVRV